MHYVEETSILFSPTQSFSSITAAEVTPADVLLSTLNEDVQKDISQVGMFCVQANRTDALLFGVSHVII